MVNALIQTTEALPKPAGDGLTKDRQLAKVCADFESLLIHYILKTGRATLPDHGFLGHSHESQVYKSMMDEKVAITVSRAGGMGVGALLYQQLAQKNENAEGLSQFE